MTTDELYEIAQKGKGESITLGWFEDNKSYYSLFGG